MIQYLRESESLRELDLSWSKLPPVSWRKFLAAIKDNRTLVSLNISHNKILEDQPKVFKKKQNKTIEAEEEEKNGSPERPEEEKKQGDSESNENNTLSQRNMETILNFKDFVKYNCYLVCLNLENTGLTSPAITFLSSLLTRAQSLRCIHLCANEGVTPEIALQI